MTAERAERRGGPTPKTLTDELALELNGILVKAEVPGFATLIELRESPFWQELMGSLLPHERTGINRGLNTLWRSGHKTLVDMQRVLWDETRAMYVRGLGEHGAWFLAQALGAPPRVEGPPATTHEELERKYAGVTDKVEQGEMFAPEEWALLTRNWHPVLREMTEMVRRRPVETRHELAINTGLLMRDGEFEGDEDFPGRIALLSLLSDEALDRVIQSFSLAPWEESQK